MKRTLAIVICLVARVGGAETFRIDPVHSRVAFAARFLGLTTVEGRFTDFRGALIYERDAPGRSSITVTIKTASLTTDFEKRDTDLKGPDWFDVPRYPAIVFQSREIRKEGEGYRMTGALTLHGITKEVSLPFSFLGEQVDPWGARLGFEGTTTLNRRDYGVNGPSGGRVVVGDEVIIRLSVVGWRDDLDKAEWATEKGKRSVGDELARVLDAKGVDAALARYKELKAAASPEYDFGGEQLNLLGLRLLAKGRTREGVAIMKLNAEAFPTDPHVQARLAGAYAQAGESQLARRAYQRALELDPFDPLALEMLRHLE